MHRRRFFVGISKYSGGETNFFKSKKVHKAACSIYAKSNISQLRSLVVY